MGALKMRLPRRSNFANGVLNSYDYFNRTSPKYNLQKSTKCKEKKELPASAALNMIFFFPTQPGFASVPHMPLQNVSKACGCFHRHDAWIPDATEQPAQNIFPVHRRTQ